MFKKNAVKESLIPGCNIAGILIHLMSTSGNMSPAELARRTDIPPATLHKILSGQTTDPRTSTLLTLAKFFNVGLDQLVGLIPLESSIKQLQDNILVPILNWNEITKHSRNLYDINKMQTSDYIFVADNNERLFALRSKPSMEPLFPRGSILIVNPEIKPSDGNYVIVYYQDTNEATLREISIDGPLQTLTSIIPSSKREVLNDTVTILGIVTQSRYDFC